MTNDREALYVRLHFIKNTGVLANGMAVVASANQVQPIAWASGVTQQERENCYINFFCDQEQ